MHRVAIHGFANSSSMNENQTNEYMNQNRALTKGELKATVTSCRNIISWLSSMNLSANMPYKLIDSHIRYIMTIECLFAYVYTEVDNYGTISDIIGTDTIVYARYTIAASLVFSEPKAMNDLLIKISTKWNEVMNSLKSLFHREDSDKFLLLNKHIERINTSIRKLICTEQYKSGRELETINEPTCRYKGDF